MKDTMLHAISLGEKLGAEYVEARGQILLKTILTTKDSRVEVVREGVETGVGVRVLAGGAWGFVTTGKVDKASLKDAVEDAYKLAVSASVMVKEPVRLAEVKSVEDKVSKKPKEDPKEVPVEEKVRVALMIDKTVYSLGRSVKSCTVDYVDVGGRSYFMNSDGTYIEQDELHVWSRVYATAMEAGVFASSIEEVGSTSGFEVFLESTPEAIGEAVSKRIGEQLRAKLPRGGRFPAVLGSNVVGVFIHEAFGHLAEADLALAGSVVLDKLGKKIASDVTSVYDDGTVEGAFGSFKYDDEGFPAQKTPLIKDGVIVGFMHNRETASKLNASPTGNARAQDFRYNPIIRMRNTYLALGDQSLEELLEEVNFGYHLKTLRGGQANLDGTFQVGVQEAYEIVKGEVGEPVRNMSIRGNTRETLSTIEAVGRDFKLWPGRCGKGQTAFVCDGGPSVRVGEVQVGGRG